MCMLNIRELNYVKDAEAIAEFNKKSRFPITSPYLDTSDIDEYFNQPSVEGFILGIFEDARIIANIQCTTAGFLAIDEGSDLLFLDNQDVVFSVETLHEYRHRGYANKLLQSAFKLAPNSVFVGIIEHSDIILGTLKDFYSNAGFDVSGYEDGLVIYSAEREV